MGVTYIDPPVIEFEINRPEFFQNRPKPTVVTLNLQKIDALLKTNLDAYVGPGGGDQHKVAKHQGVTDFLATGKPVWRPVMSAMLWDDEEDFCRSLRVRDGRHRLLNLLQRGETDVEVLVPLIQSDLFLRLLS